MSEITGVTFPVPKKYIPRFFKDKRPSSSSPPPSSKNFGAA